MPTSRRPTPNRPADPAPSGQRARGRWSQVLVLSLAAAAALVGVPQARAIGTRVQPASAAPAIRSAVQPAHAVQALPGPAPEPTAESVSAGAFRKVYDPGAPGGRQEYLNDHTFVRGPDGTWHLFGITGTEGGAAADEETFAHATAPTLTGPWTRQRPALTRNPGYFGERHLWAPHVIASGGVYYMFYAAGSDTDAAIDLATSTDLFTWTRLPSGPLFRDGFEARDPYVTRLGDEWVMFYAATSTPQCGNYVVAYRTSSDLVHWGERGVAFTDPLTGCGAGTTESPYVVARDGWRYLFIGPRGGYVGTDVFRSRDPLHFALADSAGHLATHAAEIVHDGDTDWVSAAGWSARGVSLAPLRWQAGNAVWQPAQAPVTVAGVDGRLETFAVTPDRDAIWHRRQVGPNGGWTDWERFGGPTAAEPALARAASGRLEVLAVSPGGASVLRRSQTPTGWSDWETFAGPVGGTPVVTQQADGRLEVFTVEPGGRALWHRTQLRQDGAWGGWERFGDAVGDLPAVGQDADGRLEVFATEPGGVALRRRSQVAPNGGWGDWEPFGGPLAGAPAVGRNADGRLEVIATGVGGYDVAHRWQLGAGAGWSDWSGFGGLTGGLPAVGQHADGRLEVFAVGADGTSLQRREQVAPSSGWRDWTGFGGPVAAPPALARGADGRLEAWALAPDGVSVSLRAELPGDAGWAGWEPFGTLGG